jgi:hexosaminidase
MHLPRIITILSLSPLLFPVVPIHPRGAPAAVTTGRPNWMPIPAEFTPAVGRFVIDAGLRASFTGYTEDRLERSVVRFFERLQKRTGIPFATAPDRRAERHELRIRCTGPGERVQSVRADESYTLVITAERVVLDAPNPLGILHALETLLQIVDLDSETFFWPALSVRDYPRFPWRGLLIDVARHWQPVEVILRNLDAMAAAKMNVLHWHLSEDQGFRVESKRFPRLHALGSDGLYYTQAQVREVVAYARERGIRVVPEFDMPGHTTAWFPGYPELASAPGPYEIERRWGVFDPCMDPTREEVYEFLDAFLAEMTPLFPDAYWHIGGDEVNGRQWNNSGRIAAFKKDHGMNTNGDLQAYFNKRLIALLARHGKQPAGWDEILHPDLPKSAVIQSWRGQAGLAEGARQGFAGLLSWGYYLDHLRPASFHYQVDPLARQAESLSAEEKARVLGGEACMWGEYLTSENIDSRIWPRAAAVAERLWSPAQVKDVDDMYRRLACVSWNLELLGLTHTTGYEQMRKRLAGGKDLPALKTLGDIVEPVKQLARGRLRPYTSLTPMNRLVDAVPPESDLARFFNGLVDRWLADPAARSSHTDELRSWLVRWHDNHALLQAAPEPSFLLTELAPLSETMSALAASGLQAIDYVESTRPPAEAWSREQEELLQRAERPQAELLIMITPGIRRLVAAAGALREGPVR